MIIRQARPTDYKELMELYNGFVGENRYSNYNNDSFNKVIESKNNFIYVAEENNRLTGFATFSARVVVRYPRPIAELDELYVDPTVRKKGVGTMLMNEILKKAKELNCHRLFIETHKDRKEAHQFYERLGFINYGYHFIKDL